MIPYPYAKSISIKYLEWEPSTYPKTVTVASLSEDLQKYEDTVGTYNIVPGETYNGRPVWKHLQKFIYFHGKYLFLCLFA